MLDKIIADFWELIRKSGLSFALLVAICLYFYVRQEKLERKQDDCAVEIRTLLIQYKDQQSETLRVIERNTDAFDRLEKKLNN